MKRPRIDTTQNLKLERILLQTSSLGKEEKEKEKGKEEGKDRQEKQKQEELLTSEDTH
jgi:hypothetical protein